jgi:signal transduction histidine kinase
MRSFWISPEQLIVEKFDIVDGIRSALSLLENQLHSHQIELEIISGGEGYQLCGNRIHFEQIVINLVINAMHSLDESAKPDKKILINVYRMNDDAAVEIIDNGIGLPGSAGELIFDPFFSTKKPGIGTGLGLAIVKRFVERFGGSVNARNNEFGGALFSLILPLHRDHPQTAPDTEISYENFGR